MKEQGAWSGPSDPGDLRVGEERGVGREICVRGAGGGFTLIELLVVVAVIAVLAGITLAAMGGVNQKAARDRTKAEISAIEAALERYKAREGDFPMVNNSGRALSSLLGPYLELTAGQTNSAGELVDPFGSAYVYRYPPENNFVKPDVFSVGADGQSGSADDIKNWR